MDLITQIDLFVFSVLSSQNLSSIYFLAFFSYYYFYIYLLAFSFYIYLFEKDWNTLRLLILLSILGFAIIYSIKYTVKRERFENSPIQKLDYSFPSSHSYFATLIILFSLYRVRNPIFSAISIVFSIFSIFSILLLKLHFFSDVVFSIILAFVFFKIFTTQSILDKISKQIQLLKKTI